MHQLPTFSLQMVAITSSGGVPKSSVMIENWWTSVAGHRLGSVDFHIGTSMFLLLTIFSWEQWISLQHFGKDTTSTPYIDYATWIRNIKIFTMQHFTCHIVLLPCQHNLWCSIISCRYITCHLGILNTSKSKITDLQVTVFIDENVAWFLDWITWLGWCTYICARYCKFTDQITMDDACWMYIFQSSLKWNHVSKIELPSQSSSTCQGLIQKVLYKLLFQWPRLK